MRKLLILLPMLLAATPALAQQPDPSGSASDGIRVPRELTDPAMADRLANVMQALSSAFLNLPVGEVQAAVEGRQATPAEKRMTVGDLARRDDPDFDRRFQQRIANARPMMRQSMKALSEALPAMIQGLDQAGRTLERAAANLPD